MSRRTSGGRMAATTALIGLALAACTIEQDLTPRVEAGATATPSASPAPAVTPSPTASPTASSTPAASPSPTGSPTPETSPSEDVIAVPSPSPSPSPQPSPSPSPQPSPSPSPQPSPSPSPSPEQANQAPLASADSIEVAEDDAVTHAVLANDEDPDGDPLSLLSVSTPSHGSATISAGQVRYEPDPDHNGSDAFSYTIGDGRGGTASATVSVSVRSVNDAPVAQPDGTYLVQVGERLLISDLLANDSDVDGDGLSIGQVSDGSVGTVSIVDDATVAYQHGGDTTATTDEFTYRTSDGRTLSDPVTVALHINRPPEAGTDYMRVRARSVTHSVNVITGAAIANCCDSGDGERWSPRTDSDPDGDPVRLVGWEPDTARPAAITGFSCASSGRCDVTIQGCSTVKWSVTYTISDGRGGSDANQFRIESFHSCIE